MCSFIYPFPKGHILDSSKLKQFADDNFKFDGNDRKFSKRSENTVGKGEIARHEQFLHFPQCFQKICLTGMLKTRSCLGKSLILILTIFLLSHLLLSRAKIVGERERNESCCNDCHRILEKYLDQN